MKKFSANDIAENTGGRIIAGAPGTEVSGVSTDTRQPCGGKAFFALSGDNFDAHDFLGNAASAGADVLVAEREEAVPAGYGGAVILVPCALAAYQDLAAWYRQLIDPTVIAVTGSVGKTTQKDMIATAAKGSYRMIATEGNYNNHIGVPMTIFRMEEDTELLVLEMGMNHEGEIRRLAEIARPDIAVITNIGISHRENFDSDEGILNAKLEIAAYFGAGNALFVNGDDAKLRAHARRSDLAYDVVTAGESEGCDFRITPPRYSGEEEISFAMQSERNAIVRFTIPAAGLYNGVSAALAASALARAGIPESVSAERLRQLTRTDHRLRLIQCGDIKIIDDTYNASPDSMRSAIDYLASLDGGRKIAVLAGMNELGKRSSALHRDVGEYAAEAGVDELLAVGEKGAAIASGFAAAAGSAGGRGASAKYPSNADAIDALGRMVKGGDVILVKGSRAMKTEEIVEALKSARTETGARTGGGK
ncbi:MAG: UDP-N-acetylmuramoyl-tripeptide--D-alanyl-D-alanine ligase [Clostridiales Family XIII bacterium]|jgi:UDP-N-acetylmuramoyl-tripeptide--D-alanyl-D-alanine ligase|nr:UDP-N-acetylmuramoyl-tripeptide--D-alanyl-D-alanine ligase [Clostridiales Family XIII bacterium]